jgi:hypothetical protein
MCAHVCCVCGSRHFAHCLAMRSRCVTAGRGVCRKRSWATWVRRIRTEWVSRPDMGASAPVRAHAACGGRLTADTAWVTVAGLCPHGASPHGLDPATAATRTCVQGLCADRPSMRTRWCCCWAGSQGLGRCEVPSCCCITRACSWRACVCVCVCAVAFGNWARWRVQWLLLAGHARRVVVCGCAACVNDFC